MLLDTSSLMYRAFFGLPTTIADAEGQPVNAVHGYLDMTARLLASHRPDAIVHVYDDDWRPAARVAVYPNFKAHRPPDPAGLPPQFDLLEAVLDAFGAERASAPEWEADDAIGALCMQAAPGDTIEIVTGDRDLLQLVRDRAPTVRLLFTQKGVSDLMAFDEAAVEAKYGVPASRYVEYATLRGDPSDGLPGVAGVGEKTARKLVTAYPSIDALLADLKHHPPALAKRLDAARDYLEAMRKVVPIRTDIAVTRRSGPRDDERLRALGERHRLGGPIRRLAAALDSQSAHGGSRGNR
ncbi:MAG: 5'-3' exonuclease [Chloroflexi bacterium]|nr:5'-3' exonuclease [Chloroflexota bacterium]